MMKWNFDSWGDMAENNLGSVWFERKQEKMGINRV
jgi:hypothetical protein